jgi:hypothetical protein
LHEFGSAGSQAEIVGREQSRPGLQNLLQSLKFEAHCGRLLRGALSASLRIAGASYEVRQWQPRLKLLTRADLLHGEK